MVEITGSCLVWLLPIPYIYNYLLQSVNLCPVKVTGYRVSLQRHAISLYLSVFDCGFFLPDVGTRNSLKGDYFLLKVLICEIGFCWSSNSCVLSRANERMKRQWILPYVTYLTPYLCRRSCQDDSAFLQFLDLYFNEFTFSMFF